MIPAVRGGLGQLLERVAIDTSLARSLLGEPTLPLRGVRQGEAFQERAAPKLRHQLVVACFGGCDICRVVALDDLRVQSEVMGALYCVATQRSPGRMERLVQTVAGLGRGAFRPEIKQERVARYAVTA